MYIATSWNDGTWRPRTLTIAHFVFEHPIIGSVDCTGRKTTAKRATYDADSPAECADGRQEVHDLAASVIERVRAQHQKH